MYAFLRRHLPRWLAEVVLVLWYVVLLTLVILLSGSPAGEFRYGLL